MNFNSVGDGAQQLLLRNNNTQIKSELNRLSAQLSSGEIADKAKAMSGDTARFSAIDHSLNMLKTMKDRNSETALSLTTMQRTLDSVNVKRSALSETLTLITPSSLPFQIEGAARNATEAFASLVNTLNTQLADKSLFSGTAVGEPALAPAPDMMADLVTAIGAATTKADIQTAIDFWFDDPAGGFATMGYTGDTGAQVERRLDADTVITIDTRADDPQLREVLKGAAMAAVVDAIPGLSANVKTGLLFDGGISLLAASSDVAAVQARLGSAEQEVERYRVRQSAEETALTLSRNDLANDDPFETASALQAVQLQLETHYAMTARLSRLSLLEYIR